MVASMTNFMKRSALAMVALGLMAVAEGRANADTIYATADAGSGSVFGTLDLATGVFFPDLDLDVDVGLEDDVGVRHEPDLGGRDALCEARPTWAAKHQRKTVYTISTPGTLGPTDPRQRPDLRPHSAPWAHNNGGNNMAWPRGRAGSPRSARMTIRTPSSTKFYRMAAACGQARSARASPAETSSRPGVWPTARMEFCISTRHLIQVEVVDQLYTVDRRPGR